MMAGPVTRTRGMDRKIAVGTNEILECPEALSAYQHTKAEAVLQRQGYCVPLLNASGGLPGDTSAGAEAPACPEDPSLQRVT
jgi:hypothetical protein